MQATIEISGGIKTLVTHVAQQDLQETTWLSYQELLASDQPADWELGAQIRRNFALKLSQQLQLD